MNRREFLRISSNAVLAGTAVHFIGCGTQLAYSNGLGSNTSTDRPGLIGDNHPIPGQHIARLTQAEVSSGDPLVMSIRGQADHDHTIRFSNSDLMDISNGKKVRLTSTDADSSVGTHNHTVTFN